MPGVLGICYDTPSPLDWGTLSIAGNTAPGVNNDTFMTPSRLPWPLATQESVFAIANPFLHKSEAVPAHPYWPGGDNSGVTWGVGWDAGGRTAQQIRDTWSDLPKADLDKLAACAGLVGAKANEKLPDVKAIKIPKDVSLDVFGTDSLPDYYEQTKKAFPGLTGLPAGTQAALLSLVYNRGGGMGKEKKDKKGNVKLDRRFEMRAIRTAVTFLDLPEIAKQLRAMERVWKGSDIEKGMKIRREDEAGLVDFDIFLYGNGLTSTWVPLVWP